MAKRSAHLTRLLIEGMSSFSPYKGGRITYVREYDPLPQINIDMATHMDITRAVKVLFERGELTRQELKMLNYVAMDGRLSRRQISEMIQINEGVYVDQRTISRRLGSAYLKISKFLGFEYSDTRILKMVSKRMGNPPPYLLNDDEIDKIQQIMEKQ